MKKILVSSVSTYNRLSDKVQTHNKTHCTNIATRIKHVYKLYPTCTNKTMYPKCKTTIDNVVKYTQMCIYIHNIQKYITAMSIS